MTQNFILLTRLVSEEVNPSFSVEGKEKAVKERIRTYCPEVVWTKNFVVMGPWDYVDIFQAPDAETAMKVAALVRSHGGAHTEVWPAMEWESFKDILHSFDEEEKYVTSPEYAVQPSQMLQRGRL